MKTVCLRTSIIFALTYTAALIAYFAGQLPFDAFSLPTVFGIAAVAWIVAVAFG